MSPATDERTAPDRPSGAVPLVPAEGADERGPAPAPLLTERDFWRAVATTALGSVGRWVR